MENQLSMHDVVPVFYVDPAYYYYEPQLGTEKASTQNAEYKVPSLSYSRISRSAQLFTVISMMI